MAKKSRGKKYDAAYLKAVEEIDKDRVNEIKGMVKSLLEAIVQAERDRRKLDEKLAFLKADLEDIRHGRIEKLKKRREEDKQGSALSPVKPAELEKLETYYYKMLNQTTMPITTSATIWGSATSGNFTLNDGSVVTVSDKSDANANDSDLRFGR